MRAFIETLPDADDEGAAYFTRPHPPLSEDEIRAAEKRFGHRLPPSLHAVYAEIANGGFGPAYGMLGLVGGAKQEDGNDALAQYELFRQPDDEDPLWAWPDGLLPVVHLGCAMFLCVDCTGAAGYVTWWDPNALVDGEPLDDAMFESDVTFEHMMDAWMRGEDVEALVAEASEAVRARKTPT